MALEWGRWGQFVLMIPSQTCCIYFVVTHWFVLILDENPVFTSWIFNGNNVVERQQKQLEI